jgi:hypothetical protein
MGNRVVLCLCPANILQGVGGQTSSPTRIPTRSPTRVPCSSSGYPSPYPIGTDAALLNTVLGAWRGVACDGVITFTSDNARLQLSTSYTFTGHKVHILHTLKGVLREGLEKEGGIMMFSPSRRSLQIDACGRLFGNCECHVVVPHRSC